MSLLGPWYNTIGNEYGAYVIPFFILVILSIPVLFFVNYKFVYKDFEVSKNKKMKLSFFTALANAPYELLIPYGQFGTMISKYDLMLRRLGYEIHIHICYTRHLCRCSKHRKSFSSKFRYFKIPF